ncbi:MAG: hypothetical protein QOE55_6032 [Acidobacteriaceae bacterium]|nr:hypothetical protein [Acidobacteriaceae bacterium]
MSTTSRNSGRSQTLNAEVELNLSFVGRHFEGQLLLLEPFGEGNRPEGSPFEWPKS